MRSFRGYCVEVAVCWCVAMAAYVAARLLGLTDVDLVLAFLAGAGVACGIEVACNWDLIRRRLHGRGSGR